MTAAIDVAKSIIRHLRNRPWFVGGIVVTLMLGIGANAALFSVIDRLLLRPPLHVQDTDSLRLVYLHSFYSGGRHFSGTGTSHKYYVELKDLDAFESLEVTGGWRPRVGEGASAPRVTAKVTTPTLFTQTGVRPRLGRFFTEEEDRPGAPLVVVLGYGFWDSHFARDPDAVGQTLKLDGEIFEIIGVAPRGFTGVTMSPVDLWLPIHGSASALHFDDRLDSMNWFWVSMSARIKPGLTPQAAAEEASAALRAINEEYRPHSDERNHITLESLIAAERSDGPQSSQIALWLAGVSLVVLVIACANVANMLLVRGVQRRRETALRLALGMGRLRLVLQTLGESLAVALLGGTAALVLAHWAGSLVRSLLAPSVDWSDPVVTPRLILFAFAVSVFSGLFAGVLPALQARRPDLVEDLKAGSQTLSASRSPLRTGLLLAQTVLSVLLLVGAGLFTVSLLKVEQLDLGYEQDNLYLLRPQLEDGLEKADEALLFENAMSRLRSLPQVEQVAASATTPFQSNMSMAMTVSGSNGIPDTDAQGPNIVGISPDYFSTLGIGLLQGRLLNSGEVTENSNVTLVNRTMADLVWPEEGALGQCIYFNGQEDLCIEVIGVVEDAKQTSYQSPQALLYYVPYRLRQIGLRALWVRTSTPTPDTTAWRESLHALDPRVRHVQIEPLRDIIDPHKRTWRIGATLFSLLGLLALSVAAFGLYSILAFEVTQRRQEMGIRAALGAATRQLMGHILRRSMGWALIGVILGLALAALAAPELEEQLFRTSPHQPIVYFSAGLVLLLAALAASLLPSWRAAKADPVGTLKAE